jgi:hypothetical protein
MYHTSLDSSIPAHKYFGNKSPDCFLKILTKMTFRSSTIRFVVIFGILLITVVDSALDSRGKQLRVENTISVQAVDKGIVKGAERKSLKQFMVQRFKNQERSLMISDDNVALCQKCNLPEELNNMTIVSDAFSPLTCFVDTINGLGQVLFSVFLLLIVLPVGAIQSCFMDVSTCLPSILSIILLLPLSLLQVPVLILLNIFTCGNVFGRVQMKSLDVNDFNLLLSGLLNDDSFVDNIKDIDNFHRREEKNMNGPNAIRESLEAAIQLNMGENDIGTFIAKEIKKSLQLIANTVDETSNGDFGMCLPKIFFIGSNEVKLSSTELLLLNLHPNLFCLCYSFLLISCVWFNFFVF